jgi:carbohydrate kinase (thermoresistant glucokinase family)
MIIVLIGPMGCGKTTIGQLLSRKLSWPFYDGDDFHPQVNIEKMRKAIPLTDEDRQPWLKRLHEEMLRLNQSGRNAIFACSALKRTYRQTIGIDQNAVRSVYLKGSYGMIRDRLKNRNHPYMDDNLLKSQMETMEEPEDGLTVDISMSPENIVQIVLTALGISTELRS